MDLRTYITVTPDWPTPGVNFLDIGGILGNPTAFAECIDQMRLKLTKHVPTSFVAIESRGFVFAAALGYALKVPIYMARKAGKLPGPCARYSYHTEYSQDTLELQTNCDLGASPMIIDDLLATGGSILAVTALIRDNFAVESVSAMTVINLEFLPGAARLHAAGVDYRYLIRYDQ